MTWKFYQALRPKPRDKNGGTMKKVLLLVLCLSFVITAVNANTMQPDHVKKPLESPARAKLVSNDRFTPAYQFTTAPMVLVESFYDYMIGSYSGFPIRNIPNEHGGYFITFHARRTAETAATRRTFYAHLDATGNILNMNEISLVTNAEGYPNLGVDPVSSKPMYAWHADADGDGILDVQFTTDAYYFGPDYQSSGLFNEIIQVIDNPLDVLLDGVVASSDNAFIWPTIQIGPSPTAGMRRVYVGARNNVSHTLSGDPSENLLIAYADFNGPMIEAAEELAWSYTSIPELDIWNHAQGDFRRPSYTLTVDNLGNIYYAGHRITRGADDFSLDEPHLDVFMCPNYGEGTWTCISDYSEIPTWNPVDPGGSNYFDIDGPIHWDTVNSSHSNAVTTNDGKIIFPVLYSVNTNENTYYPAFHTVKAVIFDTATEEYSISEIYPQKNPADDYNEVYTPWDIEEPWGEAEWIYEDGQYYIDPELIWPFPHWNDEMHDNAMMFHYNGVRVSEPNDDGLMVAVWQDSNRARHYNQYPDSYPELAAYADVPEIYIAVSNDNGAQWSEPIVLNKVDTPELAGLKPMWVYPVDKVITTGQDSEGRTLGKFGLLFYDDNTWGSNAIALPAHPVNDGGTVMFAEMQLTFPASNADGIVPQITRILNQNYPNPFNPETTISFDMTAPGTAKLDIYNVKGQLVKSLFDGVASSGRNSLIWDSTDNGGKAVTSGIYFYRLSTKNHKETRKMMLMK